MWKPDEYRELKEAYDNYSKMRPLSDKQLKLLIDSFDNIIFTMDAFGVSHLERMGYIAERNSLINIQRARERKV